MTYIVFSGRVNGKWSNGATGEKRGLSLLIVADTAVYKTTLWQEDADWAIQSISKGDEVYMCGQVSGLWKNEDKIQGIEISQAEILSYKKFNDVKKDLLDQINKRETKENEI